MRELFPLGSSEQVLMRLRQHWVIFARQAFIYLLFLALPFGLWWLQQRFLPELFLDSTSFMTIAMELLMSAYLLFVLQAFFTAWVDYALDVWIITNQRVLNVVQSGLFHRTVSELDLGNIQDVSSNIKGVFSTMFNFGTITVETAGEQDHFVFPNLPHPEQVAKKLLELSRVSSATKKQATQPVEPTQPPKPKR